MEWNKIFLIQIFSLICLILIFSISISNAIDSYNLYSGSLNLYLNQNNSVGSQLVEYYVAVQYLNATPLNITANINGKSVNEVYSSTLWFKSNTNCTMRILTNLNQSVNHILRVSVNKDTTPMMNQSIFSFVNNDNIVIYFEIANPIITKTHINAILGIVGIGLFCANPILSYILSDKAKDKFKFLFILMSIGIISIGLALGFIYG